MFEIPINLTYQRNTINKTYQNIREKRISLIKTNSDTEQIRFSRYNFRSKSVTCNQLLK